MTDERKAPTPLIAVALVVLLFMASLRFRFLDPLVIGSWHGNLGADFFSVPRSFLNLMAGHSMFDTAFTPYGPYATAFFFHPAVSLLFGSWLAQFTPWVAYSLFVVVSIGMLLYAGSLFERELRYATLLLMGSLPVYLMLWNAQMHVFTVLSCCLVFAGLLELARGNAGPGAGRKIFAGVLVSLLTKPLILILLPYLLLVGPARRATLQALGCYAVVSALFLVVPFLNPAGDNSTHWTNIVRESATIRFVKAELFSLPTYINLIAGREVYTGGIVKLPLLAALLPALGMLRPRDEQGRALLALLGGVLMVSCYYLAYTTVWEYHYATLFTVVPVLLILVRRQVLRLTPASRWLLVVGFVFLYLPTPCWFFRGDLANIFSWITFCRSFRVLPAMVVYGVLLFETARFALGRGGTAPEIR